MKLKEIAELVGGEIVGDPEIDITGVSSIHDARPGTITFVAEGKYLKEAHRTNASAIIVSRKHAPDINASLLIVDNPHYAFARALEIFYEQPVSHTGVSEEAFLGPRVTVGNAVSIHPFAYVGEDATIGNRVSLFPHVYVGSGSSIGNDTVVYPNVTIRENVKIGNRVIIHPGAVIGSDGFGYVQMRDEHYKVPQVGGVVIEDNVEIGANVTVDRGTVGNTFIGRGTKIDNNVQIAHNVKIGRHCILVAHVAIGGSVEIEDNVVLAGQAGVRDHVRIGKGAIVGARSGVGHDIPEGAAYSGTPAVPHRTWLRAQSIYARLPDYVRRLQELERKVIKEGQSNAGQ